MTCAPDAATFRLLDDTVGWEQTEVADLVGFADPAGVRLAHPGPDPDGPTREDLLPWFPDPRLAPGCRPCSWYLVAGRRLLRRDTCTGGWTPVWPRERDPHLRAPRAVAANGHRVAVVDGDRVLVWHNEGDQLVAVIRTHRPRLVALGQDGRILVARAGSTDLRRFTPDGRPCGVLRTGVPGELLGVRVGPCGAVWLLTDDLRVYRDGVESTVESMVDELAAGALVSADENGFCLREPGPDGDHVTTCHTWLGEPADHPPASPGRYAATGQFHTDLIDSGISRCRWHRVRIDADVPPGTAVSVAFVVTEDGHHADSDWQHVPPGITDLLVDQPPGRFLTARVRLSGDTSATPVLHRIRLDFPRTTSADLLPAAFRVDPAADDFTERFLSLFDATLADLDRVIERHPALLDPHGVPDRALPWLAGLLGLTFESGWDAATRRALLAAAPWLYRWRGTRQALARAIRIVFGVEPVLDELADERAWATVSAPGPAPGLGSVRLFGRTTTRFRLDGSALGAAPLRAYGDPDTDPLTAHAHRFRVRLPGPADERAVRRLVTRQAPAHTEATVHTGGAGFVVGTRSAVGVDTAFVPLPPPVLGGPHPLRLNHDGVLRPGPRGARHGLEVGVVSAVGIHTRVS
ncbi:phage tail protein [Actinophytocola xinjiangensis]|uniref:Phage tail protein n=1 Tax=Actinophytocola xinjiangensis TaxID=485602 RepID=A0A7Z0WLG6_9PSEU|nr:phage tail protein [Actinophytocola xinjiangensis]OLF10187.1 phage tail protein [Actinophytocola xinjiangensis]